MESRVIINPPRIRLTLQGLGMLGLGAVYSIVFWGPSESLTRGVKDVMAMGLLGLLAGASIGVGLTWIWWAVRNTPSLEASEHELVIRPHAPFIERRARWSEIDCILQFRYFSTWTGPRYYIRFGTGDNPTLEISRGRLRSPIPEVITRLVEETGARHVRYVQRDPPRRESLVEILVPAMIGVLIGLLAHQYF